MKNNDTPIYAITSLIFALSSWVIFGIILAPLSIALGIKSLSLKEKGSGMAIAGIVIGSIGVSVYVLGLVFISSVASYI